MKYRSLTLWLLLLVGTLLAGGCSWPGRIRELETFAQDTEVWAAKMREYLKCHSPAQGKPADCSNTDPTEDPPPGPIWR